MGVVWEVEVGVGFRCTSVCLLSLGTSKKKKARKIILLRKPSQVCKVKYLRMKGRAAIIYVFPSHFLPVPPPTLLMQNKTKKQLTMGWKAEKYRDPCQ